MPELKPVAIVGLGAIMPEAFDVPTFWNNIKSGRYSISEVPADRWKTALYYDADPNVPDKTYSIIGSWVRGFKLEPLKWGIAIPPRVLEHMDESQQWAIAASRQALLDYGYPNRPLNSNRVAVILGNAMGGEMHYNSTLRIRTPDFQQALAAVPQFKNLSLDIQQALLSGMLANIRATIPDTTEDTMPGELSNIIAGRVANVFNFRGPNFTTDAACASTLAAIHAAAEGLNNFTFDAVLTGGVDRMMGPEGFVKFSKIGALSPDGSRPYADGANGFVMGEGAGILLLKRLEDAERDGDVIYGVIRGIGSSSDGKGKGITAPNPSGQQQAIERAWKNSGLDPASVGLIEGHGTSTRVGDLAEVSSLDTIFGQFGLPNGKIALGSVKSNIGHLKSAAGAAGMLKAVLALHEKVLPPSLNFIRPNPNIDFTHLPFYVNTQLRGWEVKKDEVRRVGVSSFGFGGTNFHVVLEEYRPGVLTAEKTGYPGVNIVSAAVEAPTPEPVMTFAAVKPYRGLMFLGANSPAELRQALVEVIERVKAGEAPLSGVPAPKELARPERIAIDYGDGAEFLKRGERALKGFDAAPGTNPWTALVAHGVFRGSKDAGKVAFLFPGQGSQYVNMLKDLCAVEPLAAETFAEADRIMEPILGRPLTSFIYVDGDEASLAEAEKALRNTEITQPAMLTADVALLRLMNKFGFQPDIVIGHSLGEYAALVAAGVLTFAEALEVVSARGREMSKVTWADNGCMAAVSAPIAEVEKLLQGVDGYVVIANINSPLQSVIGGTTEAVEAALAAFAAAGYQGTKIPVSHAFHTKIVEPASGPLRQVIQRMNVQLPRRKVVANVTGEIYPNTRDEILDILARQVASPVQFVKGMQTLYSFGARVFVEIGPKRVLNALAMDNLKGKTDVMILATNHPREGAVVSFNKAICGLYAAGIGPKDEQDPMTINPAGTAPTMSADVPLKAVVLSPLAESGAGHGVVGEETVRRFVLELVSEKTGYPVEMLDLELDLEADLGVDTVKQAELFAAVRTHFGLDRREDLRLSDYNTLAKVIGYVLDGLPRAVPQPPAPDPTPSSGLGVENSTARPAAQLTVQAEPQRVAAPFRREPESIRDGRQPLSGSVVISGAGLGLPGRNGHVFDDSNIQSILNGDVRIDPFSDETRRKMLSKRVVRLIKSESGAVMQHIAKIEQTIKLGGQRGVFNLSEEFGVPADRVQATDISTQLAIAAGIDALRDAGIPLVMSYKRTSRGTYLPDRWRLPEALADETGVIFGSAFPGLDQMATETARYHEYDALIRQAGELRGMLALVPDQQLDLRRTIEGRIRELEEEALSKDYHFDRRFVFRVLAMGHSQFAEHIGARGPNTHINAACATTTHAVATAEDWIRTGRARRVVIVAGDDVTSGELVNWVGTGLMASGAATVEGNPRLAILPFDRRRNGMVMGMGGAALVVESEDALRERGMRGIAEVMASVIANSAYHGTRLDVHHVTEMMGRLVHTAEQRFGIRREEFASRMVFVSHETYTPARGGSASAEIRALRQTFGDKANRVVIANTKGYTGHTMGVGVEDVVAVKALETGLIPPIANIHDGFEPDPDLGDLNLSKGGSYRPEFALRLGAGFGSQIALTLLRKVAGEGERINPLEYQRWLAEIAGYDQARTEVVKHTLRIQDQGEPVRQPRKSEWEYGQGPTQWAAESQLAPTSAPGQPHSEPKDSAITRREPVPASLPGNNLDEIKNYVLGIVSEKTGYPPEMLDLDLDLEADLGIDTVKQAELFAAVRNHYGISRREDLRLSEYNTLAKVIGFVSDSLTPVPANPVLEVGTLPAQPAANIETGAIQSYVLSIVSEKTGYPPEMLDLDLDLEADLGIDTVKQAELFAAVRTHFAIERSDDLRLSDYNTLTKVIGFVQQGLAAQTPASTPTAAQAMPSTGAPDVVEEISEALPSYPRRVPQVILRPRLDLCVPSGIHLDETSRVVVVGDQGAVGESLARRLRGRGVQVLAVGDPSVGADLENLRAFAAEGTVQGVYFLPALDVEPALAEMDLAGFQRELNRRALAFYRVLRAIPGQPFLVCATRMGGLHGFSQAGAAAPMGGLAGGLTKALGMERPNTFVKVVDFELDAPDSTISARLVGETLADPAVVEVGWEKDLRYTVHLVETAPAESTSFDLQPGSVFVVSGGSGGITGPVILDLARATRGTFYLLSRTELPDPGSPDVASLKNDRSGLKAELMRRLQERGEKATPAIVEQKIASLERGAHTLETIAAVEKAGGRAVYLQCDVTDARSTFAAVAAVARAEGRVDVLLHAAGYEKSRKLETKSEEEFQQTLAVKAVGFFNLFSALRENGRTPRGVVFFSSVAGRFGNTGQADYSAANDFLAKLASALPQQVPGIKAIALDWGAWAEVGMASRGFIPELMKRVGIEMMQPQRAAGLVRRELLGARTGSEVLLAGALGVLSEERRPDGGLDLDRANAVLNANAPVHTLLTRAVGLNLAEGVVLEAELNPVQEPFLRDHALNGIPLLPGVMGIEGLTTAARQAASVLASETGGFKVTRVEDIQFLSAVKFYRGQSRKITWKANVVRCAEGLVAEVKLESLRELYGREPEKIIHFTGKVFLEAVEDEVEEPVHSAPYWNGSGTLAAEEIYKLYFHGPAFQVLEGVQKSGKEILGKLSANQLALTSVGHSLSTAPVLVELCLQTAGVWEIGTTGTLALPRSIGWFKLFRAEPHGEELFAVVTPTSAEDGRPHFHALVVDKAGRVYLELYDYRTEALSYSVEKNLMGPVEAWLKAEG